MSKIKILYYRLRVFLFLWPPGTEPRWLRLLPGRPAHKAPAVPLFGRLVLQLYCLPTTLPTEVSLLMERLAVGLMIAATRLMALAGWLQRRTIWDDRVAAQWRVLDGDFLPDEPAYDPARDNPVIRRAALTVGALALVLVLVCVGLPLVASGLR